MNAGPPADAPDVTTIARVPADCARCARADVTVVVPCHNEELTIAPVVMQFRRVLPQARVVVADNLSTDRTAEAAAGAGAEVIVVPIPGKGRAVRRLLEQCTSDVVIMVDGDATYDAGVAPALVHAIVCDGYDLANVARLEPKTGELAGQPYRAGHRLGNKLLTGTQRRLTGILLQDILTGYKAMSRRFVTSLPVRSRGFQLEVEIAAHAVAMDFAYTELPGRYLARPEGSVSKLSTYSDGVSILRTILRLYRDIHPFAAFTALAAPWFLFSLVLVTGPIYDYVTTGLVPRFPSLIAGVATFIVAMLLLTSGWILERTRGLRRDLLLVAANDLERALALARASGNPALVRRVRGTDHLH